MTTPRNAKSSSRRASIELYVNVDLAGRNKKKRQVTEEERPDQQDTNNNNSRMSKISGIYRRKNDTKQRRHNDNNNDNDENDKNIDCDTLELIIPDLCGRGDPEIFEEISYHNNNNDNNHNNSKQIIEKTMTNYDLLNVIADAHHQNDHHHMMSSKFEIRRTLSQPFRKSKSFYQGICTFFSMSRSTTK